MKNSFNSRKNPSHLKEFSHPVDDDAKGAEKDDSQTGGEKEEAKEKRAPEKEKPECQYGVGCYRSECCFCFTKTVWLVQRSVNVIHVFILILLFSLQYLVLNIF